MQNEPWSIELLRRMTRQQFNARVKAGDLPPTDLAVQLMTEKLGRRVDKIGNSDINPGERSAGG